MSRKAVPSLKRASDSGATYYKRQYEISQQHDKDNYDQIKFRVRKGGKDILKAYAEQMKATHPDDAKYSSLNSLIIHLLEDEIGESLS